jgi:hypothetical protein
MLYISKPVSESSLYVSSDAIIEVRRVASDVSHTSGMNAKRMVEMDKLVE